MLHRVRNLLKRLVCYLKNVNDITVTNMKLKEPINTFSLNNENLHQTLWWNSHTTQDSTHYLNNSSQKNYDENLQTSVEEQ
jgi:hypothetical protein